MTHTCLVLLNRTQHIEALKTRQVLGSLTTLRRRIVWGGKTSLSHHLWSASPAMLQQQSPLCNYKAECCLKPHYYSGPAHCRLKGGRVSECSARHWACIPTEQRRGFIRMKCKDVIKLSINRLNLNAASRLSVKERSGSKHVFMLKKSSNNKIFFFKGSLIYSKKTELFSPIAAPTKY